MLLVSSDRPRTAHAVALAEQATCAVGGRGEPLQPHLRERFPSNSLLFNFQIKKGEFGRSPPKRVRAAARSRSEFGGKVSAYGTGSPIPAEKLPSLAE